jgi:PPOX class probable F420-dependent enzyme
VVRTSSKERFTVISRDYIRLHGSRFHARGFRQDVIVYTEPNAAKVRHVRAHPRVSFNLDTDGNGAGIVIVGGVASVDAEGADPLTDERYVAKYGEYAASLGFSKEFLAAYNTRLKIAVDKVWTTPTGG